MPFDPTWRHQIKQDPAMTRLPGTHITILSDGAQRPGNIALPLPKGLHGAAAKMAVTKMIAHGWLQEVDANLYRGEPLWPETGNGRVTTLIATTAGLDSIGIESVVIKTVAAMRKANPVFDQALRDVAKPVAIRTGTKQAQIIARLERPEGASIAEIGETTGWMSHSIRGLISGGLKEKLGQPVVTEKQDGRGTIYKLSAASPYVLSRTFKQATQRVTA